MAIKKIVDWYFTFKGMQIHKKKVYFSEEMLIDFIGEFWFKLFIDSKTGLLKYTIDYIIATAREVGKTYVAVAIVIYFMINDPLSNFVLTRKYGSGAGSFYEMFNQVLNDLQDKYEIKFRIQFSEEMPGTRKKRDGKFVKDEDGNQLYNPPTYKTMKEINRLKGKGITSLFSYGKTGDDKLAIFYNDDYDTTNNQICFLRGADDADGSRGLSVNRGAVYAVLLEEYSQEVDKGKLSPDEQVTRYQSLWKSSNRYSIKMVQKNPEKFPEGFRTANLALANIWDPEHKYNKALLTVIPESEWREFVLDDPENNTHILREFNGNVYFRATSAFNEFLYPKGSEARKTLIKEMKDVASGNDDYAKAEILGFTFPGFIRFDNPLQSIIYSIIDAEEMELDEFKSKYKITRAEYGTDPGLRDAWACTPVYLGDSKNGSKLYINELFIVDNQERKRNKMTAIPNPVLKQMQLEFWKEDLKKLPIDIQNFLEVNMDMRALSIREDYNYEIFPRENINGQCVAIPSQESQGFGLEQRPIILADKISKMVFNPAAKQQILQALKTLEQYADDKRQPHPRKGKVDIYDSLCYGIVKLRGYV